MFAKASTIFAVFAVAARVAVAAPPACLLAAVNEHPDPADIKTICSDASKVTSYLSEKCGDHEDAATKYFKEVCENNDAEYSGSNSTSSSTASRSGSKTASATGTLSTSSSKNSTNTDSDIPLVTGASTLATGVSGAASASGTGIISDANNGTVLSTAGTAGPTTSGNAGTSPTGSASQSGAASEGGAARMGFEAVGVAVFGVVGAMMVL